MKARHTLTTSFALILAALAFSTTANNASAQYSPQVRQEFVQLHARFANDIIQRVNNMHAKLNQIKQQVQTITGSRYVSIRSRMLIRVNILKQKIGTYGAYSITTPNQIKLLVPNEDLLDRLINDLEDLVDDLEDRADNADDDAMEDFADDLEDLIDDADRLEGRLTNKTNCLKRAWARKDGQVGYF